MWMSEERTFVCEAVVGDVSHMECDLVIDASYFRSARSTRLSDGTRVVEERTCSLEAMDGWVRCSRCGAFVRMGCVTDATGCIPIRFCSSCGARVLGGDAS